VSSKRALFFPPEPNVSTSSDNQKLNSLPIWSCVIDFCNVRTEQLANNSLDVTSQSFTPVTIPHMTVAGQTLSTASALPFSRLHAGHW
jgi:hypothetical protein